MEYVYLLQEIDFDGVSPTGLYKIGQTRVDVDQRKRQYKAGNARRVDTLHTIQVTDAQAVETELHRHWEYFRVDHGGGDEWFDFGGIDTDSVIAFMNEYDETPVYAPPSYSYATSYSSGSPGSDWSDSFSSIGVGLLICIGLFFGVARLGQLPQVCMSAQIEAPAPYEAYLRSVPQAGDQFIIRDGRTGEKMQIATGEQVTACEISPDHQWRQVKLSDGRFGWVASNFVK